jgi:hypothetical protein
MLPFEDRFSRQRRLPEVGPEGQRTLGESRVSLAPHPDVDIERDYLERAGVTLIGFEGPSSTPQLADAEPCAPAFPWAEAFEFAAARSVACGAWCALARIRRVLALH